MLFRYYADALARHVAEEPLRLQRFAAGHRAFVPIAILAVVAIMVVAVLISVEVAERRRIREQLSAVQRRSPSRFVVIQGGKREVEFRNFTVRRM